MEKNNLIGQSEAEWDSAIDQSLSHDAEASPKFATVPNARLSAQLAAHPLAGGMFATLASKLALFAVGIVVVSAAIYLIPRNGQQTNSPSQTVPTPNVTSPAVQPTAPQPPVVTQQSNAPATNRSTANSKIIAKTTGTARTMTLDDTDGRPMKTYVDPNYQPPLK